MMQVREERRDPLPFPEDRVPEDVDELAFLWEGDTIFSSER